MAAASRAPVSLFLTVLCYFEPRISTEERRAQVSNVALEKGKGDGEKEKTGKRREERKKTKKKRQTDKKTKSEK